MAHRNEHRYKLKAMGLNKVPSKHRNTAKIPDEYYRQIHFRVRYSGMAGDFGADLILHGPEGRITVQAKRYSGNVGNKAVQEAYSGMAHYGVDKGGG